MSWSTGIAPTNCSNANRWARTTRPSTLNLPYPFHERTPIQGQYGAERREVQFIRNVPVVRYVRLAHRRNEAIDLYVMNLAVLRSLGQTFSERLGKRSERLRTQTPTATEPPELAEDA